MVHNAEFRNAKMDLLVERDSASINERLTEIESRNPVLADELYRDPEVVAHERGLMQRESRRDERASVVLNWLTGGGPRPERDATS
ncbi:hypothetical protein CcI49_23210 [Frankia sp. CcI49]|uniref:hypothetical protein n=1 Tax=Frankia sp. CcI49 TaxID=1745382 RepID=UPI0009C8B5E8|nr:hypothetical protein [Frankia sp. CcI49]ONH58367.1 hypothetical protein CcI49_23210 [Frankia sp. CcI49]